jgi:uncharacterized RDD family membrane protein YckC
MKKEVGHLFCVRCGNQLVENSNFCSRCGEVQGDTSQFKAKESPAQVIHHQPYVPYAGFWLRVAATILDTLIVFIPLQLLIGVLGVAISYSGSIISYDVQVIFSILLNLLRIASAILYKSLMECSSKQATLGKIIVGIKVTDLYGNRITFGKAIGRYFASIINAFSLNLLYLMAAFTDKKQCVQDMIAGTLVVKK